MQGIGLILFVALIWLFSGWLMGVALRALFGVQWVSICSALNLAVGMILLRLFTRSEREQEIIFEGKERKDGESSAVGILVIIPSAVVFAAIVWILFAIFVLASE